MKKMKDATGWTAMNETAVRLTQGSLSLEAVLGLPAQALGMVVFAHGSGSGRFSPRNNFVARILQQGKVATLLIDLLTPDEAEDRRKVFDIDLLAGRVLLAKAWLEQDARTKGLGIGYFGASTGAGAALQAAARDPSSIRAVVSRGGRPDLAEPYLPSVTTPTLLIVGGEDFPVIQMNQDAFAQLTCPKKLVIVPGATHLFEEPGALEQVAEHALIWFQQHFHPTSHEGTDARTKERLP
jgi:putative phosphoribosyl transferase